MKKYLISNQLDLVIPEDDFKKQVSGYVYNLLISEFEVFSLTNVELFQEISIDKLDSMLVTELNKLSFVNIENSIFDIVSFDESIANKNIIITLTYSKVLSIRFDILNESDTNVNIKIKSFVIF